MQQKKEQANQNLKNQTPAFEVMVRETNTFLFLSGRIDAKSSSELLPEGISIISRIQTPNLILDLGSVEYLDTAGAAFLCLLEDEYTTTRGKFFFIENLKPSYLSLLNLIKEVRRADLDATRPATLSFVENQGKSLMDKLFGAREFISYTGEIAYALALSLLNPKKIRWADTFLVAERAGVDALPIVALISFIVGLVMAFQAAIPMRMFGAELYVANLIGISMVRELGPLMTAIILAGRSASAFAAEIGTMRINEEIDALTVMGLDPVKFLIVPRVIAATFITPLLTIFSNLVGILGGAVVIISMGYPLISYYDQIASFVDFGDFFSGLAKCFVFGVLIAVSGCIRGYQTGTGPSAVGQSTTRAVVTGIILIAIFDGIFSIIYYSLGI